MMNKSNRRGYTLTELLVVVMIVVMLIGVTLPIAKKVMDDSRTREAARLLSSQCTMAQMHAARSGRPWGLWFELEAPIGYVDPTQPAPPNRLPIVRQCTKVYLAEVQAPYAGATTNARGIIRIEPSQTYPEFVPLNGQDSDSNGRIDEDTGERAFLLSLIEEGETCLIKFDSKGDWFRCIRGTASHATFSDPQKIYYPFVAPNLAQGSTSGRTQPPAFDQAWRTGFGFQVLRQPKRVGNPMELTAGTCIDMSYSGLGRTGFGLGRNPNGWPDHGGFSVAGTRLVILFNAGGAIDGMYLDGHAVGDVEGTVHFLIGQTAKMNPPHAPQGTNPDHPTNTNMFDPAQSNLTDTNSVWVSVGRRNGSVTSTENLPPPVDQTTLSPTNVTIFPGDPRQQILDPTATADRQVYLAWCRELATGRDQMGGN